MKHMEVVFERPYHNLIEIEMDTVNLIKGLLDIKTEVIYQSDLSYNRENKNSDLMKNLCISSGTDIYLSGNGARNYMNIESFERDGIRVCYQNFEYPVYQQFELETFVPNLSAVDMLFHLGIEHSREVFWNNVDRGKEFEEENR